MLADPPTPTPLVLVDREPGYVGRAFRGIGAQFPKSDRRAKGHGLVLVAALLLVVLVVTAVAAIVTWTETASSTLTGGVLLGAPVLLVLGGMGVLLWVEYRRAKP
jgi:hypothetical protein